MYSSSDGPHGLLLLDKPTGITSHDLVGRVRRGLHTRKVGHAGTLDPAATGLMLVGVGDATRLLTYLVADEKEYETTVRLGIATDTEDADGEVTSVSPAEQVDGITIALVHDAADRFVGPIDQVPSAVSAIKVDGKRAYQRVRDGEEVELAARRITVHELKVLRLAHGEVGGHRVADLDLRVRCSAGTYIRALGRDLGNALGVGAHLSSLRRASIGSFHVREAVALVAQRPERESAEATAEAAQLRDALVPLPEFLALRFPHFIAADAAQSRALRNGQRIAAPEMIELPLAATSRHRTPESPSHEPATSIPAGDLKPETPVAVFGTNGEPIGLLEVSGGRTRTLMNFPQRDGVAS